MKKTRKEFLQQAASIGLFSAIGRACRPATAIAATTATPPPQLTMGVISDVHVCMADDGHTFVKNHDCATLLNTLTWYRDQGVDAVMIAGDMSDVGHVNSLERIAETWFKVFPNDKAPDGRPVARLFATGNHDWDGWTYQGAAKRERNYKTSIRLNHAKAWERIFHEPYQAVWHKQVKGFDVVGHHWEGNDWSRMAEWFKLNGKKLDPRKPFFYVQHPQLKDTCYGSATYGVGRWGTAKGIVRDCWGHDNGVTTKALAQFPNAVAFSGHSHYPVTDERAFWCEEFTSICTASLRYTCNHDTWWKPGYENGTGSQDRLCERDGYHYDSRQGLLVRVYDDRIVYTRRDFMYNLSLGDDLVQPFTPATRGAFTWKARSAKETAPSFAPEAKLTLSRTMCKKRGAKKGDALVAAIQISIPAPARTKCRAMEFSIELTGGGKTVTRAAHVHGYDYAPEDRRAKEPTVINVAASPFADAKKVSVKVWPVTALGTKGKALVGTLEG